MAKRKQLQSKDDFLFFESFFIQEDEIEEVVDVEDVIAPVKGLSTNGT